MANIQPGQMLGPYRIIIQVGKGGMANVYKAYQPSVDRYVAIKVLPSQLGESPEFVSRFQQEARIIAKLEHPHILPVFDYGESEGVAYFVMRYLEAGTLKDRMESGRPLPTKEIDRIFTQLASALSYAHTHGIVHRDLKPANALIDSHDNIFLTDFGIARLLESASPRLTQTDAIMGTPAYISPEQAQALQVDQRSDIYSLGVILYEMVTGRVPFVADTPLAILLKHVSDPLPPPSLLKPDIPRPIEQVLLKALAKNPDDRFASSTEFVEAWKRALEEKETVRSTAEVKPAAPAPSPRTTQAAPAPGTVASTTTRSAARPTGWIVGCLVGVCLLFSLAGVVALASSWGAPSFLAPSTETAAPLPTGTSSPPTDVPQPTPTTGVPNTPGRVLLDDDFASRSSNWGTLTDENSSIEYAGDALHMLVFTKNYFVWSTPNTTDYENIHVEVTAIGNDTDPTTAFGIMCAQQEENASFYYLAITPAGEYAIAKAAAGETDLFLTNNDKWASSDLIPFQAPSYRVGADCGNGRLTLYVDGQEIASVTDSTYTSGVVGVFTWSGEDADSADVIFDDFLVRSLE